MNDSGPCWLKSGFAVRVCIPLAAAILAVGTGPVHPQPGEPDAACVLGWPGVAQRFVLRSDGSAGCAEDGPRILEWIDLGDENGRLGPSSDRASLGWMLPGVRVVRAVREAEGLELVTLTGADLYGRPTGSLWLFRAVTLTNTRPEPRTCRLAIRVTFDEGSGDLALRRGSVLTEGGHVRLLVSQKADDSRLASEPRQALLWFDLDLPAKASTELLMAAPGVSTIGDGADVPELRHLQGPDVMQRIASQWQRLVVPETLTVGAPLVNGSLHAAVSSLILSPPNGRAEATQVAAWMSALARVRQGAVASGTVESLVEDRRSTGGFSQAPDRVARADLTTALADYARYADEPNRMGRLLWPTLSATAADLAAEAAETRGARVRARASLALTEAAKVADLLEQQPRATEWRQCAAELLRPDRGRADAAPSLTDPFSSRAYAAVLRSVATSGAPAVTDAHLSLSECLGRAHVALLAGSASDRLLAWQVVEDKLRARPLPGVTMHSGQEDTLAAAQLVTLVCDAVCQADPARLHLFPALPLRWLHEGLVAELRRFPSGAGPIDLRLSSRRRRVTLAPLALPKGATQVRMNPPLGVEIVSLGVDGRRLKQEALRNGPPWQLDPATEKVTMQFAHPPDE